MIKKSKLKVCLYLQNPRLYRGSGIGQALKHQQKALELNSIDYTLDPHDGDYQVLHVNSQTPGSLLTIIKNKKIQKKIIIHAHATSEDFKKTFFFSNWVSPIIHWWFNIFYSYADLIICPTTYTRDLLKNNYSRLKNKKMVVISNGVDIEKWKPNKIRADKFIEDYKIKKPMIFSVGFAFPRKGIIDFIKIAKNISGAHFVWIGRYLKGLFRNKNLGREFKNSPKNFLLTGYVEDIMGAYSAGDIFFFPSYEENEGIVVLEAAAMGKPIIVRDIPVFRSYLKNKENCLMGKTNDDFVAHINTLLSNQKLREKLSKNARRLAESKSLKLIGKNLKEVYLDILGN